jgi:hypothetical protein
MTSLSMTSSKLETQAEQMRIQTSQRNKLVKQRALAIHLLQFTISSKFSASSMDRKSLETFLDVGESADPDILMNSALAISNLSSHPSLRPILLELNCVHRYSSFLPLLVTPHTSLGGGLFLYYMSCETEVEDRLCSAGFKTLQKNSLSDNFQLRIVTLQCLSNLMPCQERIRVAEQVVSTLHQLYRDYLDETWNEEILQVLLRVTSFPNCLRAMMEADVMDIISLAAAEVRDNISCGRLIARILSHFLHQLDLGEDLIHADFSRIFIDLLSLDDLVITELCMHAFAVMSSHELLISSVADSDIVHIVCGFIASTDTSLQIQIVEDIARYLCNICQPSSKVLEQRVHDGAAHALLDLFRLCPNNDHIQRYAIIGLRDLLTNLNNCQTLASLLAPALLEMLKLNVEMSQKLDVNVVQCVYNLCLCSECHDYLLLTPELQVDVVLYKILTQVYQRESVSVIKALLQVLIILADMEIVVFRLISHGILEFLVSLVEFSVASETKITSSPRGPHHGAAAAASVAAGAAYKECWNDVSRLLLVMIHSQPQLTPQQENSIVKILPLIGTKSSSEEIISDCAVILAFLSFTLQNFTAVDPIVRSIIHLSESDNVMDATSTVLYNISCSDLETFPATATPGAAPVLEGSTPPPPSMLLSDGMLHVNMMIKMMRNGNIRIQQNIAETMKLLCIHARCNELLLRNDLLSDFIVIALLRTNSPTVKKVCSEAFYNMLCHHSTRKRLLSGDLWWAMMRLSKTDLSSVRMICAKAVYNLTCDPLNVKPLRNNYILSFIKEIAFEEEDQEYQDIFLHVLHRIVSYALESSSSAAALSSSSAPSTSALVKSSSSVSGYHEPLNHTEMVAVIQILINALSKSKTIDSSQWIGYLLATIAKECLETKEINEFIHMDLISMLKLGSGIWLHDMVCRRYFSTVLSLLCSQYSFTNATLINDLLPVLSLLMNHEEDVGRGVMQPLPLDQIICEDICSVLYSYAVRQQIDIITMISIPFFPTLMTYALTGVSPYKQHLQRLQSSSSPYSGPATTAPGAAAGAPQQNELESTDAADAMEMETNAMVDEPVTTLCALFLKLLVFVLPKLFDPSAGLETRMTSSRSLYSKKSPAIEVIYKVKSSLPMRGFLNTQLYLNDLTRNNTLYLLQTICSSHEEKVRELLQLNYFMLLHHLLTATPLPSSASYAQHKNLFNSLPFLEFCSVFVRNVSAFPNLHPLLVQSVDLDAFLMALVKYKDDILLTSSSLKSSLITKNNLSLSSFETDSLHRLYDITVMLYHLSLYRLYPSSSSPSPSSTSASGGGGRGQHVITPSVVLNIISEVTSHANGDHLLSHITKLIIGLVVDKTEDGNGFDPSFIREILTEINDENSLDEQQIAEFMKPKLQLQYLEVDMGSLPPRTVPRRPLEVLSKEEIDALWVPLVSSQRKKMEYFPMIAPAATGGAGGAAGALAAASPLSIDPVLPFPMATYDKIIQRYPFVTEPVLLEAKREREEKIFSSSAATARGAGVGENGELLGVLEEEIEDFPNMTTAEFEERHGPSPGAAPLGPSAGGERAEMASPIPPSPATSSYPLSPRPPDAAQRSTPNMKSAGRLLVQSKGASASSIQRNLSNDSAQSPARKRTTSS